MINELKRKIIELLADENRGMFEDEIMDEINKGEKQYTAEQFNFVVSRMLKMELIRTNEEGDIFYLN